MGSIILLFFVQHVFLFTAIFWLLTFLAEWFFNKKNHATKKQFFECGFKAINDINIQINLNFSLVCVFLILYDVEFTFLFPLLFNFGYLNLVSGFIFFCFLYFIFLSVYYDLLNCSLNISN